MGGLVLALAFAEWSGGVVFVAKVVKVVWRTMWVQVQVRKWMWMWKWKWKRRCGMLDLGLRWAVRLYSARW